MKGSLFSHSPPHHSTSNHTFSDTIMEENIDSAEQVISKWDIDTHKHIGHDFSSMFVHDRKEANIFLEAVDNLQKAMHYYLNHSSSSHKFNRAQNLMQIAIKRLEKEFYFILSANRKNLDSDSVSARASARSSISGFSDDEISEEDKTTTSRTPPRSGDAIAETDRDVDIAVANLRSIADCMIASGHAKECVNIFKLIRKSIIDETLYNLGVEKLNQSQIQKMDWNVLEPIIKSWLHAVKVAVKNLFHGERILCDTVFSSSEKIAKSCFTEISKEAALNLFSFPDNFAKSKKILSPEKMFRALDLYEAISNLWPEIESIFSHDSLSAVRSEAEAALVKLGEAVRTMLTQFEAAIQKDSSKTPTGGGVHPLTRYVMNYLVFLGDYSGGVSAIFKDWSASSQAPLPESYFSGPISGVGEDTTAAEEAAKLAWLILVLLCKLDGKAAMYSDVALSYLFLANNLNYVVSKVQQSNLGLLMGPAWIYRNQSKVHQFLANYERMGWSKVLSSLPQDPTAEISSLEASGCLRRFDSSFEEAYKAQSSWVIPDPTLQDEVKKSLVKKIVPGYRAFYEEHIGNYATPSESIVRYTPENLNNYLLDLFHAGGGSADSSKNDSV